MSLDWMPRDDKLKDHALVGDGHWGEHDQPPCTVYEKVPLRDPKGAEVRGLYSARITLNNPAQLNSYTTEMVKGVIAGFQAASSDRSVVAAVFTGSGDRAFCTGGNTKEYSEYYSQAPERVRRVHGALQRDGGRHPPLQEAHALPRERDARSPAARRSAWPATSRSATDLAIFGQAGPRHGSAPDGGSTDFLPWFLSMEDALWNCVSCELWSATKMKMKGVITKVVPALRIDGEFVPNPLVIADRYVDDGDIVFGEMKTGAAAKEARALIKSHPKDLSRLDAAVYEIVWKFTNLFPGCLMKSIDGIRAKKKSSWDQAKLANRHWLAANMSCEGFLGFGAFNTKRTTGKDVVDFVRYRQLVAEGALMDEAAFEQVLGKPTE